MNISLSQIVAGYLAEMNLGQAEYAKAYQIAIRGWRELNWDLTGFTKTVQLVTDADKTAMLPDDFIKEIIVGIDNGNGGIASLTRSNNINQLSTIDNDSDFYPNRINFIDPTTSTTYTQSYGLGSSIEVGKYYLDSKAHRIVLSPLNYGGNLMLKYLASTNDDCEYEINEFASEALLAYIRWKMSMAGSRANANTTDYNRREYFREKANARMRIKRPTTADMNQSSRTSTKMSIRS